ncbi:hypothetical protein N657DRAFT_78746 [Parathielavia appendiculata]|uniref:Uncharacterized protein n=1 Tax=Parathielavia appendiculata TaxID=2587402 RepID=A0AAN6UAK8_9PEZI|nr:hypothetical protein N657DRAFT_78746 [Parathielavia appendiculata]
MASTYHALELAVGLTRAHDGYAESRWCWITPAREPASRVRGNSYDCSLDLHGRVGALASGSPFWPAAREVATISITLQCDDGGPPWRQSHDLSVQSTQRHNATPQEEALVLVGTCRVASTLAFDLCKLGDTCGPHAPYRTLERHDSSNPEL